MNNVIIQAGGKGTRLEKYTRNKPKCLVAVNNLPIIFYAFRKFPQARFQIICDYRCDVLEKYMKVYGKNVDYKLIKTHDDGTCAGIRSALENIPVKEQFLLMWSDLILADTWECPDAIDANYIGISKDFECRWSYVSEAGLYKKASKENGVAGLFIFKNKEEIIDVPTSGAFVRYLKQKKMSFSTVDLYGTREVGTILSYKECDDTSNKCRPFNKMEFIGDLVVKTGITDQGKKLALNEVDWYDKVRSLGYQNIPKLYQMNPLKMEKINGRNIFEYENLLKSQKKEILLSLVKALDSLHRLIKPIEANADDVIDNYYNKTFNRIKDVRDLIPFAHDEFIMVNGKKCKNVFYLEDEIKKKVKAFMPAEFFLIHGDSTFSNIMFDAFNEKCILIDPRGYFGKSKYFGDIDYDWAKLYYSLKGNYDQFNRKNFTLTINDEDVTLNIGSNHWEDMENDFFNMIPNANEDKIKFIHALIWISLTTYAWEDYDSICGAFYNGIYCLNEVMENDATVFSS